jgi:4-amino-4-deoxy-L-arabinose transferase-like glycosyltransferase
MGNIKQKEWLILILCLIIGFTLRFYTFDQKSLWLDEVHTFNDSRDDLRGQIEFYKENPTSLQAPLFFVLTHLFYPFQKPERDLRIIPLIFGTLSIPMIYFLSRLFSPGIALPCALSLTFMAYHIYLSQDGRSYSLLLFLGMASLYLFLKHLKTSGKRSLLGSAIVFSLLFYTSYSSIPFILFSQILWFYRTDEDVERKRLSSGLMLNGVLLLLCLPWILFLAIHYQGQPIMEDPLQSKFPISFLGIFYGILHDWVPHAPLLVASVILLIVLSFFHKPKENALLLMTIFILPIGSLYAFCKLFNITHFITSRYFINFLPVFLVIIYLALDSIEIKFEKLKRLVRLKLLFIILFVASNVIILPFYYRSEKQDFRGLVTYLKLNLQEGDKIFCGGVGHLPVMLHYFGTYPKKRVYGLSFRKGPGGEIQFSHSFTYRNKRFTIYHSKNCCNQYIADGRRLWIVVEKDNAKKLRQNTFLVLKGYFDGSFLNFDKFPLDVSLYLFLWDPKSTEEKGIDLPIE